MVRSPLRASRHGTTPPSFHPASRNASLRRCRREPCGLRGCLGAILSPSRRSPGTRNSVDIGDHTRPNDSRVLSADQSRCIRMAIEKPAPADDRPTATRTDRDRNPARRHGVAPRFSTARGSHPEGLSATGPDDRRLRRRRPASGISAPRRVPLDRMSVARRLGRAAEPPRRRNRGLLAVAAASTLARLLPMNFTEAC